MKIIYLFTSLFYISNIANKQDCIYDLFSRVDKSLINKYEKNETINEFGIRHTIDSINYTIIRRWKDDRTPIIQTISNELMNIDYWKEYHDNGKILAIGYMTSSRHTKIGTWKYYSSTGKVDSIVNYDKRYKVSFCDFYKIALKKNLTGKTSEIWFDTEDRKWLIKKWTYKADSSIGEGIELQVDSMKINKFNSIRIH